MTQEDYYNITSIIEGDDKELNAVESRINILTCPIAKRKGIMFSAEECAEWSKDLKQFLVEQENKEYIHTN